MQAHLQVTPELTEAMHRCALELGDEDAHIVLELTVAPPGAEVTPRSAVAEADLDNLLRSIDDGVLFLDEGLRMRRFNGPAAELFGLADTDVGRPFPAPEPTIAMIRAVMASGDRQAREMLDPRGAPVLVRAHPYRANGAVAGVVITLVDISDLRSKDDHIRDLTAAISSEARQHGTVEHRERFIATLSHELRNPLMGVVAAADRLAADPEVLMRHCNALDVVHRQTAHMAKLMDDLLDVSRARTDGIEIQRRLLDLRETTSQILDAIRKYAERAEVQLDFDMPKEALWILGDKRRLQQIQVNLLRNAISHSPPGATVRVAMARDGAHVVCQVIDEGSGIPSEMIEAIFEPFVQCGPRRPYVGGPGLGLGLSLARSLARGHGGEISVESAGRGCGSTFTLQIPWADHAPAAGEEAPLSVRPSSNLVLVVEDDPDNRQLMGELLALRGYEVLLAESGSRAIELILERRPPIALVDLGLPDISGLEVARRARRQMPDAELYLVALTGHGQHQDRRATHAAGFDEHLVKPVGLDVLHRVLSAGLSRSELCADAE